MTDHILKTIADAQAKLAAQESVVRDTKRMINQLCEFAGQPPMYADVDARVSSVSPYRGDEYYGEVQHTACRKILERRKTLDLGPATVDEIYEDLKAGGYQFDAKSEGIARRGVQQMLTKNSTTFHRLPHNKYGLSDWYSESVRKKTRRKEGDEANGSADDSESENPEVEG